MQVFRGTLRDWIPHPTDGALSKEQVCTDGCVLTIGNFDGIHRGHMALLSHLRSKAKALGLPASVLTFEPHPRDFFAPHAAPARLTSLREKLALLDAAGVDHVHICHFTRRTASLTAENFIEDVLVQRLGVKYLVIGDDFRFGKGRQGDFAMLQDAGDRHGFPVEAMPTLVQDSERVSSSRVRDCLEKGDLRHAEKLLARPYSIAGRVGHGKKLGRTIGYPTLNILLKQRTPPLKGVFTVMVEGISDKPLAGVANIGIRPSVASDGKTTLEVHLFDYSGDLYGRYVRVVFLRKQRDEQKFDGLDALMAQIKADADEARAWFAHHPQALRTNSALPLGWPQE